MDEGVLNLVRWMKAMPKGLNQLYICGLTISPPKIQLDSIYFLELFDRYKIEDRYTIEYPWRFYVDVEGVEVFCISDHDPYMKEDK